MGLGRQGILDHSGEPTWKTQAQALTGYRDRDPRSDQGSHSQALRLMSKSLQWGLSTEGPVEPSLQECSLPSKQAGDASPVSGCFSEVTLGVSWHLWAHL